VSVELSRRALIGGGIAVAGGLLLPVEAEAARKRRVVVWSEGTAPKGVYPNDINGAIADGLKPLKGWDIRVANINEPEQGLPDDLLNSTDVLIWWGHARHGDVQDALVEKIVRRVKVDGMGFIPTHSAHYAKPLRAVLGTNCGWAGGYFEDGSPVEIIVKAPKHPIARGVSNFVIPKTERYCDPFEVPTPEALVFDGVYALPNGSKQNAQQGMTWTVGKGRIFYFQPVHETYPYYTMPEVARIFRNAVEWCARK
jgi:trehalose utilization protein